MSQYDQVLGANELNTILGEILPAQAAVVGEHSSSGYLIGTDLLGAMPAVSPAVMPAAPAAPSFFVAQRWGHPTWQWAGLAAVLGGLTVWLKK